MMGSKTAVMKAGLKSKVPNLAVTKVQNLAVKKACSHFHRMVPNRPPLDHLETHRLIQ